MMRPGSAAVHPHACGEHCAQADRSCVGAGSSPRLWGTRRPSPKKRLGRRFIPTPVGNTLRVSWAPASPPVHPHACGEHYSRRRKRRKASRFIPTPVGNTKKEANREREIAVHPHACGEHFAFGSAEALTNGSSPRLWGTQAGPFLITCRVHPHACGEHGV